MNVIQLERTDAGVRPWSATELRAIADACAGAIGSGQASGWAIGETERGDPQFHLIGPAPDFDCIATVSRLGVLYVLEDGMGGVVLEQSRLAAIVDRVRLQFVRGRRALLARLALVWLAAREFVEEKVEPIINESGELIVHVAPQLAVFA
jgi:hypothetical protein